MGFPGRCQIFARLLDNTTAIPELASFRKGRIFRRRSLSHPCPVAVLSFGTVCGHQSGGDGAA